MFLVLSSMLPFLTGRQAHSGGSHTQGILAWWVEWWAVGEGMALSARTHLKTSLASLSLKEGKKRRNLSRKKASNPRRQAGDSGQAVPGTFWEALPFLHFLL